MKEIRVYYGALEQANDFIKPYIKSYSEDIMIKLVKLSKYSHSNKLNEIQGILQWKDPDILISVVYDDKEQVLFMIEFSTSVFTRDHELQRFDNYIPLFSQDFIHVKISTTKKESVSHGGDTDFDHTMPFALIFQSTKKIPYFFEWPLEKNGNLQTDSTYKSCPVTIPELEKLIHISLDNYCNNSCEWLENTAKSEEFANWKDRLESKKLEDITIHSSERLRYDPSTKTFELKINRLGHAMDPERGMLCYYGLLHDKIKARMVFKPDKKTWYSCTGREQEIENYVRDKTELDRYDLAYCFMLGTSINKTDFIDFLEEAKTKTHVSVNEFIKKHYETLSKPLKVIFSFSDSLEISDGQDQKITFTYTRKKFKNREIKSTISKLKKHEYDEDDVTYIVIHNVLKANNCHVISASYPDAQGDRVMLIERDAGRKQKREYIDIVFIIENILHLHENKSKFKKKDLRNDSEKLALYKKPDRYETIKKFLQRYTSFDISSRDCVRIGVGFASDKNIVLSELNFLNDLDYFIYINSRDKKWAIWQCGENNIFKVMRGDVKLPSNIYKMV